MSHSLVELAKQQTSNSRADVLDAVSQLFVAGSAQHSPRELMLFSDIMMRLVDQVTEADRVALAERIAHTIETPRDLAVKLAYDEAPIAAPILQFSPALTEADLVGIAGSVGQEHLLLIARRAHIAVNVTDVLVGRGELRVLDAAARNQTAQFSPAGFNRLGSRAKVEPLLGDALSQRVDLPVPLARSLLTVLEPEARRRMELRLADTGERMSVLMDRAMRLVETARAEPGESRAEIRRLLVDLRSGHRRIDDTLDDLIFQRRTFDIAALLADFTGVPEAHASNAMHKINPSGIGAICRTVGVGEATFRRLSALRCDKLRLPETQIEQMVRDYMRLDTERAEAWLRPHRTRRQFADRFSV
jgi:uncharacterized protein (DUF2336 family)